MADRTRVTSFIGGTPMLKGSKETA
jgi:hypothetical protein